MQENELAAGFIIIGPISSNPVDLDESNLLIYIITCAGAIKGMINFVFLGTLPSVN